jgi:hypothetical protein
MRLPAPDDLLRLDHVARLLRAPGRAPDRLSDGALATRRSASRATQRLTRSRSSLGGRERAAPWRSLSSTVVSRIRGAGRRMQHAAQIAAALDDDVDLPVVSGD